MSKSLLALLVTLCLAACADGGSSDPDAGYPPMGNPPMGGPDTLGARPGVPLAELLDETADAGALRARLGEPLRVEAEAVPNRHVPGQTDTVRTLVYGGLALEFYEVTGGPAFLREVAVTGEGYETAEGFGVGSTRAAVEAVYTNATDAEPADGGSAVTYERYDGPDDPSPTTLEVRYEGDRAAALTWTFYVD